MFLVLPIFVLENQVEIVMSKFVNPFTDIGFKLIFGREASKDLLIVLLNELLAGEHSIEDLCFLDKEDHADNLGDKGIIYDLYCRTSTGEFIIVEMQNRWHSNFLDRTLYYVCRAVGRQTELPPPAEMFPSGDGCVVCEPMAPYGSKYKLHTVYGIFLMNFREQQLDSKFRTDAVIADRDTGRTVNPHFRQIYLQFPYFTKELDECETLYDKLIYTLKNMNNWNRMPDALKEQVFQRLSQLAAVANLSEADRIAYDKAVDSYRVSRIVEDDIREACMKKGMKQGLKKGLKEGLEKGMKQGMQQGIKQGMQQGMSQKQYEIARQMKADGTPMDAIAKYTGLAAEVIDSL